LLDEGWRLKRTLSSGITNEQIDGIYDRAKAAGAWGGKITGAGGGGFLLIVHPPERHSQIATALSPMRRLPVRITPEGSRILFVGR
jgi:D-glycero-alpha-D-manno-heptose-7-phosphate kinase